MKFFFSSIRKSLGFWILTRENILDIRTFDGGNLAARVSALIDHFLQWKKKTDKTFISIGCALMTN